MILQPLKWNYIWITFFFYCTPNSHGSSIFLLVSRVLKLLGEKIKLFDIDYCECIKINKTRNQHVDRLAGGCLFVFVLCRPAIFKVILSHFSFDCVFAWCDLRGLKLGTYNSNRYISMTSFLYTIKQGSIIQPSVLV